MQKNTKKVFHVEFRVEQNLWHFVVLIRDLPHRILKFKINPQKTKFLLWVPSRLSLSLSLANLLLFSRNCNNKISSTKPPSVQQMHIRRTSADSFKKKTPTNEISPTTCFTLPLGTKGLESRNSARGGKVYGGLRFLVTPYNSHCFEEVVEVTSVR